jgi:type IV pilus assembly protein PilM
MPVQPSGVWGIDLGQCGLKAIRLQEIDGQLVATAFDYVEHPKILSQPDADPDQLTREALDKFLSRNSLRGDIVAISVPGQSGLARFVKLPPVEEKKIHDIVKFEAKQQIPFNLDEVVWDYQKIGSGIVTDGFAMETEIGLFAMKRDMVSRYLQHFKDVGVDVHLVQMAPLALCNFVGFDLLAKDAGAEEGGGKKCIVALDIGADSSNLVITDGERIIWQRPIPLGGNHFTRALTKDLKLTFAKAEHVKRNATKSPDLKKILAALKPVLNDFVGEVQRSLGYFTNTHRDAQIQYMVGLGNAFRLPGLQKFLAEKLQLEVRKLGKMERVSGDQVVAQQVYTENILTFAVAYGLALQGIKRARLLTNLLPGEIRVERLVKAKKPFAVAAAAALLVAIGGLALSYAFEYRTYGDKRVQDSITASDRVAGQAEAANKEFEAAKNKAKEEEAAVRTIIAGQYERDNWLQLVKFINTAVPQPNAEKERKFYVPIEDGEPEVVAIPDIPDEFKKKYWLDKPAGAGAMAGHEAYQEYTRRLYSGAAGKDETPGDKSDDLGAGAEDLIQYNIESVNSLFCDDLGNFWKQVQDSPRIKNNRESLVRPQSDYAKKPEGSGWVIEIQGYTFHRDAETFVRNTLLENLARLGKPAAKEAPKGDAPAGGVPGAPAAPPPVPGQPPAEAATEDMGPVINHISHVVLYQYQQSSSKGQLELLGPTTHSQVRTMALTPAAAAGGGGGQGGMPGGTPSGMMGSPPGGAPGGMMGSPPGGAPGGTSGSDTDKAAAAGPSRDTWTPLGEAPAAGGQGNGLGLPGAGGGIRPGMPPGRGPAGMPPGRGPAIPGGMPPGGAQPAASPAEVNEAGPKRTEFVILLIWKEPTPSDGLRGQLAVAGGTTGSPAANAAPPSGTSTEQRPTSRPRRHRADADKEKKNSDADKDKKSGDAEKEKKNPDADKEKKNADTDKEKKNADADKEKKNN